MSSTVSMLDDERRDVVHEALQPLRWEGYEEGSYELRFFGDAAVLYDVGRREIATVRAINELLEQVVEWNAELVEELTESDDPDEHLELAWAAIHPIRAEGYDEGDYQVEMGDGQVLEYLATREDAEVLRRYDQLLLRIYTQNRRAVETIVRRQEEEGDDGWC